MGRYRSKPYTCLYLGGIDPFPCCKSLGFAVAMGAISARAIGSLYSTRLQRLMSEPRVFPANSAKSARRAEFARAAPVSLLEVELFKESLRMKEKKGLVCKQLRPSSDHLSPLERITRFPSVIDSVQQQKNGDLFLRESVVLDSLQHQQRSINKLFLTTSAVIESIPATPTEKHKTVFVRTSVVIDSLQHQQRSIICYS